MDFMIYNDFGKMLLFEEDTAYPKVFLSVSLA